MDSPILENLSGARIFHFTGIAMDLNPCKVINSHQFNYLKSDPDLSATGQLKWVSLIVHSFEMKQNVSARHFLVNVEPSAPRSQGGFCYYFFFFQRQSLRAIIT